MKLIRKVALLSTSLLFSFGALFGVSSPDHIDTKAADVHTFKRIDANNFVNGDYAIAYLKANGEIANLMSNTVESSRLTNAESVPTLTEDAFSSNDESIIWTITKTDDKYTIYNEAVDKYAAATGKKNKAQLLTDTTDPKVQWTATINTDGTIDFVNVENSNSNVNSTLRNNSTYGWACYSTGTGGSLTLFKDEGVDANAPVMTGVTVTGTLTNPTQYIGYDFDYSGLTFTPIYDKEGGALTSIDGADITWPALVDGQTSIVGEYLELPVTVTGLTVVTTDLFFKPTQALSADATTVDFDGYVFDLIQELTYNQTETDVPYRSLDSDKGFQFFKGSQGGSVKLTSQNSFVAEGAVIMVDSSVNSNRTGTLTVKIGGVEIGNATLTSTNTTYKFTSSSTINGKLEILLDTGDSHTAIYLNRVSACIDVVQSSATGVECADITTYVGYSNTLEPTLVPTDATNEKVFEYVSNNPTIATVDSEGNVTGVATGSATVTVTLKGTELSKTVNVSVERLSGSGTAEEPFSTDDVRKLHSIGAMPDGKGTYVYGTITTDPTISDNTAEFSIQSVGSTLESILVYKLATINGEAVTSESKLMKGDLVLICGKLSSYNNQPQVASGGDLVMRYSATAFAFVNDWMNYRYPSEGTTDFCADIENNDAELKALVERYYALDADDKAVVDATQETTFGGTQFTIGQSVVYAAEHMGIVPAASNTMTLYKGNNSMMLILVVTSCVALLGVGFFLLRKRNAK